MNQAFDVEKACKAIERATCFEDICHVFESAFGLESPEFDLILESARSARGDTTPPKTVADNIQRGKSAMKKVISSHGKEPLAMFREEVGWIGFFWGKPGNAPPVFKTSEEGQAWWDGLSDKMGTPYHGGNGVSHIVAKRDWEGKWIKPFKGQKGIDVAMALVEVIAKGKIAPRGDRFEITSGNLRAVLIPDKFWMPELSPGKKKKKNHWLLTGMEMISRSDYEFDPGGK